MSCLTLYQSRIQIFDELVHQDNENMVVVNAWTYKLVNINR
jgi:hypothetical protein